MRQPYPSDVTREQFELVRPLLESARKTTRPRTVDLYDAYCGLPYLLKSGCQWRMIPRDFPKWRTVHSYFQIWSAADGNRGSLLERALKKIVGTVRVDLGRDPSTSFLIVDGQSVKNTDSANEKGYDGGKKVSGIKRHVGVDTNGLPHAIAVTTADVTDRDGAVLMAAQSRRHLSRVRGLLADGGYAGAPFAERIDGILGATVEAVKRNEIHGFVVLPKRWVVERSFGWLEKSRRLWKNCERLLTTSRQMVTLAFLVLLQKRF